MKKIALLLFACILFSACHKSQPEVPWENFDRYHIDENLSEKGPYDNYRVTFWKADSGTYRAEVLADFAARYGWKFTAEEKADPPASAFDNLAYRQVFKKSDAVPPQWFKDSCIVYRFMPPPDQPRQRFNPGYEVFLSRDKSQMCIFNVMW